jgi:S1-C subfamily serine protease
VVANGDGAILTAAHVVSGADTIHVAFADGTETTATVASSDEASDIATLIPAALPETLVPATLGGAVEVGGPVVAIGNPLGLAASASAGVVSGLDRRADTADGTFAGLIQFDAAVNPGSSGGPLLDAGGNVVGIVVSIADPGRDRAFAGIGFAVPIGTAIGGDGPGPQI